MGTTAAIPERKTSFLVFNAEAFRQINNEDVMKSEPLLVHENFEDAKNYCDMAMGFVLKVEGKHLTKRGESYYLITKQELVYESQLVHDIHFQMTETKQSLPKDISVAIVEPPKSIEALITKVLPTHKKPIRTTTTLQLGGYKRRNVNLERKLKKHQKRK
jgi:hypothetical protein